MRDPAWQPDPPSPTPAPVDRRFGAATLGHPDLSPLPPAGMEPPGAAPGGRLGLGRRLVAAVALLVVGSFLVGQWAADRGEVVVWQAIHPIPPARR